MAAVDSSTRAGTVPVFRTTLVGRDGDAASVRALVGTRRLVTIVGPGGCGKTRLAAAVAASEGDHWAGGVHWADLQAANDPARVADVVAAAAGALIEPVAGARRSLQSHLADARALVVIDNCEHVLGAVAEMVDGLLTSCAGVTVLATSRTDLDVDGEHVWRLPSLDDASSIELFADRAREARGSFTVDSSNAASLRRLCTGLDGIPLAIELAAAWTRTLTPQQIEAGLDDRFGLLVRGSRGAAARHQTLAASIDWSHELLSDDERAVFRRLAVFSGSFTLEDAAAVCNVASTAALIPLDGLVAKSLVVAEEQAEASRFRLLESLRAYARARLVEAGEVDAIRDRHLDRLLAVAEDAEALLDTDKDTWWRIIGPQRDNLRDALAWGLSRDEPSRGRRLAAATAWMWNLHGRGAEGIGVLKRAIDRAPDDRSLLQCRLLTGYGMIGDTAAPGDLEPLHAGEELAAEHDDDRLRGRCRTMRAVGTFYGDFDNGWQLCADALRHAAAAGDAYGEDSARGLQGVILHLRSRHDDASDLLAPVLDRMLLRGDRGIASTLLVHESDGAWHRGDVGRAVELAERAAAAAEPLGDYHRVGTTRSHLALLTGRRGDPDDGLALLTPFVRRVEGAGPEVFVPGMSRTIGYLHLWRGDAAAALPWFEPDAVAAAPIDDSYLDALALPGLAAALGRLGRTDDASAVLDHADRIASRLGMAGVRADAIEQRAHLAGDPRAAFELHHEALAIRVEHRLRIDSISSLDALATILAELERMSDSARLLAAAEVARAAIGCPRHRADEPAHDAVVARLRDGLGRGGFADAWEAGSSLALEEAVALARRSRGERGRPSSGWASLTPTERDVVRCVIDGMTNPQIGAKLFISRSTVKAHLAHVFRKLGVSNRTELATYAAPRLQDGEDVGKDP